MRLLDTIAATKTGDLHFIVKDDGKPFTSKESFGNWFSARCQDAKIKKSAHGLRKLGATLAANEWRERSRVDGAIRLAEGRTGRNLHSQGR